MHSIVSNPWLSIPLALLYGICGILFIIPPATVGIDVGLFEPVFANNNDHWAISTAKNIIGGNFLLSSYMLIGPPIVVETSLLPANGWSIGPVIVLHRGLSEYAKGVILRHEYQHYCQQAVLTTIGAHALLSIHSMWLYITTTSLDDAYYLNWLEMDAFAHQHDGLRFNYIALQLGQVKYVQPQLSVSF
jgi:hypothetical protein